MRTHRLHPYLLLFVGVLLSINTLAQHTKWTLKTEYDFALKCQYVDSIPGKKATQKRTTYYYPEKDSSATLSKHLAGTKTKVNDWEWKRTGVWTWWYPNGKPMEQRELDGEQTIRYLNQWQPDGQQNLRDGVGYFLDHQDLFNDSVIYTIANGQKHGPYEEWNRHPQTGVVWKSRSGTYVNGKENGSRFQYSPKGHITNMYTMVDGVFNGPAYSTHFSGNKLAEGNYRDGEQDSTWVLYTDGTDQVFMANDFDRGRHTGQRQWSRKGHLIMEGHFKAVTLTDTVKTINLLSGNDTIVYRQKVADLKHGVWIYRNPLTGEETRRETWNNGQLVATEPKK